MKVPDAGRSVFLNNSSRAACYKSGLSLEAFHISSCCFKIKDKLKWRVSDLAHLVSQSPWLLIPLMVSVDLVDNRFNVILSIDGWAHADEKESKVLPANGAVN